MISLKKYENRKIYNPETHKYVSLKEIKDLVQNDNIQIINHKGEDETNQILIKALSSCKVKTEDLVKLFRK